MPSSRLLSRQGGRNIAIAGATGYPSPARAGIHRSVDAAVPPP
jgi:hypothetical protein